MYATTGATLQTAQYSFCGNKQLIVVRGAGLPKPVIIKFARSAKRYANRKTGVKTIPYAIWNGITGFEEKISVLKVHGNTGLSASDLALVGAMKTQGLPIMARYIMRSKVCQQRDGCGMPVTWKITIKFLSSVLL